MKHPQVGFGFFGDGGEDGQELVGFVLKTEEAGGGDNVGLGGEVEPIQRVIKLVKYFRQQDFLSYLILAPS